MRENPVTTPYPIRPAVLDFAPYSPGLSIDEIRRRFQLESVVKMASNENPLGTSPLVKDAICRAATSAFRYAQSGNPRLAEALAAHHNVPVACIVTGNGSDEVIDLLIRVCPTPGRHNVVMAEPSFSIYRLQSKLCGVEMRRVPLHEDFSFDFEKMLASVDADTALVFLTTPDNPSGYCPTREDVAAFARALPTGCLLVMDEAYMDFADDEAARSLLTCRDAFPKLVVLRTFSKSFGLAGLRLGYGVMPEPLAAALCRVRLPFSVNILAEEAGLAALQDETFRRATLECVRFGREFLSRELAALGCRVWPSMANFLMFALPAGCGHTPRSLFEALLAKGMIIRPLASYGLEAHLRVSIGTAAENSRFLELLRTELAA